MQRQQFPSAHHEHADATIPHHAHLTIAISKMDKQMTPIQTIQSDTTPSHGSIAIAILSLMQPPSSQGHVAAPQQWSSIYFPLKQRTGCLFTQKSQASSYQRRGNTKHHNCPAQLLSRPRQPIPPQRARLSNFTEERQTVARDPHSDIFQHTRGVTQVQYWERASLLVAITRLYLCLCPVAADLDDHRRK